MPYQSDIQVYDGYVKAEFAGVRRPGTEKTDHYESFTKIRDILSRENAKRLLIVSRLTGPVSPMVVFDFANNPRQVGWTHDTMIALVNANSPSDEEFKMIETLSRNRGMQVKLFKDEHNAVAWLTDG